jgi:hypothetical protein
MPRQPLAIHDEGLVTETLDTIAVERGNFDRSSDLVDDVIRKFGEPGLAERLYAVIPRERPWQDIADLFGILIWSTSDNGASLMRTMEQWLQSADVLRQGRVALHLDVYPFIDRGMMVRVLGDVASRLPEVRDRCHELIESRGRLPEAGA